MSLKRNLSLFIVALAAIFALFLLSPVRVIDIRSNDLDRSIYREAVKPGYTFATVIRHSVHLTPVFEYYKIDENGRIILTGTKLQDLGWGVPSTYSQDSRFEDGFLVIEGIDKPTDFVPFRVSYIARPCLVLDNGNRKVDLTQAVSDLDRIDIHAAKMPRWKLLLRGETDEFPQ